MTGPRGPQGDGFPGAKVTDLHISFKNVTVILISD